MNFFVQTRKISEKVKMFVLFIYSVIDIFHPQPLKVSLRNSYCATVPHGKRPKIPDVSRFFSNVDFFREGLHV